MEALMKNESKIHPVYTNYLVYRDGRIFSLKYQKFIGFKDKDGYLTVHVGNKYRRKTYQLVMDVWGKPKPTYMKKPTIDHIDGDLSNNHIDNLQWLERSDNTAKSHKTKPRLGIDHGRSKLSEKDIHDIRSLYSSGKYTLASLGRKYKVSYQHIKRIVSNQQWTHI
jgi:hypothetical protein